MAPRNRLRGDQWAVEEKTTDPGVTDDGTKGYVVGSVWLNTTTSATFICTNTTTGAALWVLVAFDNPTPATATATINNSVVSPTFSVATGMTITPVAGIYRVTFTGSMAISATGNEMLAVIYAGGTQQASSMRRARDNTAILAGAEGRFPFACEAQVTVNGSQAIEGRWAPSAGTASMFERVLIVRRVR